jgi:hypothetical protein
MVDSDAIRKRFSSLRGVLDERSRRLVAAAESLAIGRGGISVVARATGVSRQTIARGLEELAAPSGRTALPAPGSVRRAGGGRKRATEHDPTLLSDLEFLVGASSGAASLWPLQWTSKSVRVLSRELAGMGHRASHQLVAGLLRALGFDLRSGAGAELEPSQGSIDAQFSYVSRKALAVLLAGEPVIVAAARRRVPAAHDSNEGRDTPPGSESPSCPSCGAPVSEWSYKDADENTADLAATAIRRWWSMMGKPAYPGAMRILVAASVGSAARRLSSSWNRQLQKLADESRLRVAVCHLPAGTCRWNALGQWLLLSEFQDLRQGPLASHEARITLVLPPAGRSSLTGEFSFDQCPPVEHLAGDGGTVVIRSDLFQGEWNYTILPHGLFATPASAS